MRTLVPVLALALMVAACDSGGDAATTTAAPSISTTTSTTMDVRECEEVAGEAVAWVEDLVEALEGVRFEEFVDRGRWPEELVELDTRGMEDLQARSDAAGCDEGLIRGAVVSAASRMEANGRLGELLLELIAPGS